MQYQDTSTADRKDTRHVELRSIMDTALDRPGAAPFRGPSRGRQWLVYLCQIHSVNSKQNNGYLEIVEGNVTCTGTSTSEETHFKVHYNRLSVSGGDALFECIGGKSDGWMLCVNDQNQLSARKKTREYINIEDAEPDILFTIVMPDSHSSQFKIKWKKGDEFIGFDEKGQPIPLDKVNQFGDEALFTSAQLE